MSAQPLTLVRSTLAARALTAGASTAAESGEDRIEVAQKAHAVESESSERRRRDILRAALQVFAEVGYTKATTKRIAEAAGVRSPGLLYWYFPNKSELLKAVVIEYAPVLRTDTSPDSEPLDVPPDELLPRMAIGGLAFFEDSRIRQVYRLLMSEWPLLEKLGVGLRTSDRPDNVYAFLERYLDEQVRRGRLRPHNTAAAARSFISQIWAQVEARHLFPSIYPDPPDNETFVADLVELFLDGLRP